MNERMKFPYKSVHVFFCTLLKLLLIPLSHEYVYTCNSSLPCGCSANSATVTRIVGGQTAGTSTWGWAVSILINSNSLCGGSILSSSWIITAAHCVNGVSASSVIVYAGSNTRFSGQSRVASSITIHSSYASGTKANDIALIRLSTPITMSSSSISVICIPSVSAATLAAGEWPSAGQYVVAVGWGTLSSGGSLPTNLQQVTVQAIDYRASSCSSVINYQQLQFCAGVSGGGKDTCQGDSGGPLMMFTESNQWQLVGITSYGIGCAEAAYAGVYTRVAYYQTWINTITSGGYKNPISSTPANITPDLSKASIRTRHGFLSSHSLFLLFLILVVESVP